MPISQPRKSLRPTPSELSVGHVIQAAISDGMRTQAVNISDKPYCDIGTPEGLTQALRRFAVLS